MYDDIVDNNRKKQPSERLFRWAMMDFLCHFTANCLAIVVAGVILFYLLREYVTQRLNEPVVIQKKK